MVQRNMNKSELKEKIRRMKMELQELEDALDKCEDRDNRYDEEETIEEIMIMIDVNMIMKTEIENMVVVVMVGIN